MSVRKDPRSPYWSYNFQINGRRFYGSTKALPKRDAEAVERAEREKVLKILQNAQEWTYLHCRRHIILAASTSHVVHQNALTAPERLHRALPALSRRTSAVRA